MDPISGITARVSAIESRIRSGPVGDGGRFAEVLRAELGETNPGLALGYSATGGVPGADGSFDAGSLTSTAGVGAAGLSGFAGGLTPAVRLEPGEYGSLTPPAELVGYGNGQIPAEALAPIGVDGHRLWAPAATAFTTMAAAASREGVTIGVTDSYRSLAGQERVASEKGLYSQGGLAATPGTSNHGWGMSLDLDLDERAQAWMRANGPDYGFAEDVPREPWHWTYRPVGL